MIRNHRSVVPIERLEEAQELMNLSATASGRAMRFILAGALLLLAACGGGGGGGSGGATGFAAPVDPFPESPSVIVSGIVTAPAGQVAFDHRRSNLDRLAALLIPRAEAALTGLTAVADGTMVELARVNSLGEVVSSLATTTTRNGQYSFDFTQLGLVPAADLVVQVSQSGTANRLRAFVVSETTDLNPVSETVFRLALETVTARGGTLAAITAAEIGALSGAAETLADLAALPAGVNIETTVNAVRAVVNADAALMTFLADAAQPGESAVAPGDVGNYFPLPQGKAKVFNRTLSENGSAPRQLSPIKSEVAGTKLLGDIVVLAIREIDEPYSPGTETYYSLSPHALTFHGNNDLLDPLAPAIAPYDEMRFPLRHGASYVSLDKSGIDWGADEDGDGIRERVNIRQRVRVSRAAFSVTVPAGTYRNLIRVTQQTRVTVHYSRGSSETSYQIFTMWLAPDVGPIRVWDEWIWPNASTSVETWELTPATRLPWESAPPARIDVTPANTSVLIGGTGQLQAHAKDSNGQPASWVQVTWQSSDPSIVAVGSGGDVRGVRTGSAFITASYAGITSQPVRVTVADIHFIPLAANDIVYSTGAHRIFASVGEREGVNGNSIVAIDPETGAMEPPVPIGKEPNRLCGTDDGKHLYVGLDGSAEVRRFDISTRSAEELRFPLGSGFFGPLYAEDLEAFPGNSDSVAVALRYSGVSPKHAGVAVFDFGVRRPVMTPGHSGSNSIAFSASSSRLYGTNSESEYNDFYRMSIGAQGVAIDDITEGLVDAARNVLTWGAEIESENGLVYSTKGAVFDPETRRLLGTVPVERNYNAGSLRSPTSVHPDTAKSRIYYLREMNSATPRWVIESYDSGNLTLTDSVTIGNIPQDSDCGHLIRWGIDGLAFQCWTNKGSGPIGGFVAIVRSGLVP